MVFWEDQDALDRSCREGDLREWSPSLRLQYIPVWSLDLGPEAWDNLQEPIKSACRENKTRGVLDDIFHKAISQRLHSFNFLKRNQV